MSLEKVKPFLNLCDFYKHAGSHYVQMEKALYSGEHFQESIKNTVTVNLRGYKGTQNNILLNGGINILGKCQCS